MQAIRYLPFHFQPGGVPPGIGTLSIVRTSAFNFCNPFDLILPPVDTTITADDRAHLWGLFVRGGGGTRRQRQIKSLIKSRRRRSRPCSIVLALLAGMVLLLGCAVPYPKIKDIDILWKVRSPAEISRIAAEYGLPKSTTGLAWHDGSPCVIMTPPPPNRILVHEFRHCVEGDFHK